MTGFSLWGSLVSSLKPNISPTFNSKLKIITVGSRFNLLVKLYYMLGTRNFYKYTFNLSTSSGTIT